MALPKAATNKAGRGHRSSRYTTRYSAKTGAKKRRRREDVTETREQR